MPNVTNVLYSTPLPTGLAYNLTWSSNTPGTNYSSATITNVSPSLTANSVISAAVQSGTYADTNNCWLMSSVPSTANNGTITFNCYGQPATTASFKVAWAVANF
jgi:hypothetical protein